MSPHHTATGPSIQKRFQILKQVLGSRQFLAKEGIINEVPFFIFAYAPQLENEVQAQTRHLITKLENQGVNLLEINLYDLSVEIVQRRGKWERLLEKEASMPKDRFKAQLQNLIDVETKLVPAIAERISELSGLQLLFLSGVGLVYPFIRTHSVLNNLQKVAKEYPTLLFFPGGYTFTDESGQSLDLFSELNEDRYYRAFNIENYKL